MQDLLLGLIIVLLSLISQNVSNGQKFQRYRNSDDSSPSKPNIPSFPSGIPNPNGPFYGSPFNLSATMAGPYPFTVSGRCEAGTIYTITTPEDLLKNYPTELECVYNAGIPPKSVPLGTVTGSILSVLNTQMFNPNLNRVWMGQSIKQVPCEGQDMYFGYNLFDVELQRVQLPFAGFIAEIKPLKLNLAPGEYSDGMDALITDYTIDFPKLKCPQSKETERFENNVYPLNQNVDALRLVGKSSDGGSIYLAKSYLRDSYRVDLQAATVAYYYIVSQDESSSPDFKVEDSLPPLKNTFKYMHPGSVDLLQRLLPFDNFLTAPVRTFQRFLRGLINAARRVVTLPDLSSYKQDTIGVEDRNTTTQKFIIVG